MTLRSNASQGHWARCARGLSTALMLLATASLGESAVQFQDETIPSALYFERVGDVDGDGTPDVIVGSQEPGKSYALIRSGAGDHRRIRFFSAVSHGAMRMRASGAGDVDMDGFADVRLVLDGGERHILVSGWSGETLYTITITSGTPAAPAPGASIVNVQPHANRNLPRMGEGGGGSSGCPPNCTPQASCNAYLGPNGLVGEITNESSCTVGFNWAWFMLSCPPRPGCPAVPVFPATWWVNGGAVTLAPGQTAVIQGGVPGSCIKPACTYKFDLEWCGNQFVPPVRCYVFT